MIDTNTKPLRGLIEEVWNEGNVGAVDRYFAPDYVDHNPLPGQVEGPEGYKQSVGAIRDAFPDLHLTLEDILGEGDRVAFRYTMRGTHQGPFMGIPPTGNPFSVTGMIFARVAEGKAAERWANLDTLGLMQQLGAIPSPAEEQQQAQEA
ncbi:MAG: ester cyclase [Actinobacteria bacterium]|nr:MAG: ester cyclase [Actinomycetota bacterium]